MQMAILGPSHTTKTKTIPEVERGEVVSSTQHTIEWRPWTIFSTPDLVEVIHLVHYLQSLWLWIRRSSNYLYASFGGNDEVFSMCHLYTSYSQRKWLRNCPSSSYRHRHRDRDDRLQCNPSLLPSCSSAKQGKQELPLL